MCRRPTGARCPSCWRALTIVGLFFSDWNFLEQLVVGFWMSFFGWLLFWEGCKGFDFSQFGKAVERSKVAVWSWTFVVQNLNMACYDRYDHWAAWSYYFKSLEIFTKIVKLVCGCLRCYSHLSKDHQNISLPSKELPRHLRKTSARWKSNSIVIFCAKSHYIDLHDVYNVL